MKANRRRCI